VPATGDSGWGTNVSNLLIDLATSSKVLQTGSTTFTLTAGDVDFGATYGPKAAYYKSRSANPSAVGIVRLGNNESIAWRNQANSANLTLAAYTTDRLQYGGADVPTISSTDTLTNKTISGSSNTLSNIAYASLTLSGSIVNADVSNSAAIAYSKLNLATSIVNADVSGSAAIAYSKLNLATSIVNADISGSAAIAYSKLNLATSIVNADIGTSAAIALSKIAGGTTGYIPFASSSTALSNDSNLYWDNTNKRLGIGHTPAYRFGVMGEASSTYGAEIRLGSGSTAGGHHITSNDGSTQYGFFTASSSTADIGNQKASSVTNFYAGSAAVKMFLDASGNLNIAGLTASRVLVTDASKNLSSSSVTSTQLGYLSGTNGTTGTNALVLGTAPTISAINLTGSITTEITASRAVVTSGASALGASATTATELGYVSGVTSAIQTQIDGKVTTPTAWTTFDAASVGVGFTGGTSVSATNVASAYKIIGKIMHIRWGFTVSFSSAPTAMTVTIPNSQTAKVAYMVGSGRNTSQGYMLQTVCTASSGTVGVFKYDNNVPVTATGDGIALSLTIEIV
jgi:hypothetical protein